MRNTKTNQDKKLELVKLKISEIDFVVPGSLRTIYSRCGRSYCACQTNKKARHGPYVLWDRKVDGKTTSKMVSKKMAVQIKKWIENRNKLEELIQDLLEISQSIASDLVEQERIVKVGKM